MKISLRWLADYLPGPLEAAAAAEALTAGGLPIESIEQSGDDTILDVEVTSNRGDCLSHVGIARELAALLDRPFKDVTPVASESTQPASAAVSVQIDDLALCPHYTARIIRGVNVRPSPDWMIRRLQSVGIRPINNIVDVTNYVMFELGQPLHAFDFSKISGQRIIVRPARAGEKIVSIDGHERALTPGMLLIADAGAPVALAGVMGGLHSEVSAGTTDILLESARFDPLSIRKTARALMMRSDSSYRFERGIDPLLPARASLRAAQLILETAGGTLLAGMVQAGSADYQPKGLSLRRSRLKQVLGIDISLDQVIAALRRDHLSPIVRDENIDVTVPSYRLDLNQEIDLVEEVARLVGYDAIPVRQEISIRLTPPDRSAKIMEAIRQTLVAAGYFEAITFSFVSDALKDDFASDGLARADAQTRKADANLRPSLLPGLLQSLRHNESVGNGPVKLFEIGAVFSMTSGQPLVEIQKLGMVGGSELRDLRGVIENLLGRLNAEGSVSVVPRDSAGFAEGTGGVVRWGEQTIGRLGLVAPSVVEKLSLRHAPAAAELNLEALLHGAVAVPRVCPLPRFPAVRRDLSLIVAQNLAYDKIEATIRQTQAENLEQIEYVTTYRGKPLESNQKSVTVTLVFRSATATLTSEPVEAAVQKIVASAEEKLAAKLRT